MAAKSPISSVLGGCGILGAAGQEGEKAHQHDQGQEGKGEEAGTRAESDGRRGDKICSGAYEAGGAGATAPGGQGGVAVEMGQAQEAELAGAAAEAGAHDTDHADGNRISAGDEQHAAGG